MELKKSERSKLIFTELLMCVSYMFDTSYQFVLKALLLPSFSRWESQVLDDYVNSVNSHRAPFVICRLT